MCLYSGGPDAISRDEIAFLERLSEALSFLIWVLRDRIDHIRTVEDLESIKRYNKALFCAFSDFIFTCTRTGEFQTLHGPDSNLLSIFSGTLIHRKIEEVQLWPILDQPLETVADALDMDTAQELSYHLYVLGEEKHFEARAAPYDKNLAIVIVRDVTAYKLNDNHQ